MHACQPIRIIDGRQTTNFCQSIFFCQTLAVPGIAHLNSSVNHSFFQQHLLKLRSGNANAIAEFVAQYEPYIRRSLRFRIVRASLQSAADSADVCQSVLGSFLLRLSAGEYAIHTEEDLRKLLTTIANNKFLELSRHESAAKRDRSITESWSEKHELSTSHKQDPAEEIIFTEMQTHLARRLSSHELELLELRRAGKDWAEIAELLQEEQTALRKRYSRALNRVARELGLGADDE